MSSTGTEVFTDTFEITGAGKADMSEECGEEKAPEVKDSPDGYSWSAVNNVSFGYTCVLTLSFGIMIDTLDWR